MATPARILLAPMEGLLDCVLRDILTRVGGIDSCVSEFIRVTDTLLPKRAFIRVMPELLNGGRTISGVPVLGQLLGSDPVCLADNAAQLAALGPAGIDLNFGCPAKVVNRHGGGALLLNDPELIGRIVAHIPVSAKMRLGFNDDRRAEDCAQAIADAGASQLVIHARTKADGYRPPAYWERIADVRARVNIPIVANGEIWTAADALRCREVSGCAQIMIGRGMVADPALAWAIRRASSEPSSHPDSQPDSHPDSRPGSKTGSQPGSQQNTACRIDPGESTSAVSWLDIAPLLGEFWTQVSARVIPKHRAGRLKQWLNALRRNYPQAQSLYSAVRCVNDSREIESWLRSIIDHTHFTNHGLEADHRRQNKPTVYTYQGATT
jgi:tRNA-dihydrouridine synthase C